ncbi:TetR/AcrR family transcriptional regulator [Variovorax paradoxus]|nr:TetR/AcrR family transcriptional regulator [Variovorax paradoxus]MBT2299406.1 TetR/AcrR family transcriptional regulator [Variovorax paradoxus]
MPSRDLQNSPRKMPRQARSQHTVEAVLTAGAQVLIELGYEKATTSRMAERAGVSIGSLYQYFPNKESVVAALIERHADDVVAMFDTALSAPSVASIHDGLQAVIAAVFAAHRLDPKLHKILNEQVPRVGRLGKAMDTSRRITKRLESFLVERKGELRDGLDPAVAAVVTETVLEAIGHRAILQPSGSFTMRTAAPEAFALLAAYLTGHGHG